MRWGAVALPQRVDVAAAAEARRRRARPPSSGAPATVSVELVPSAAVDDAAATTAAPDWAAATALLHSGQRAPCRLVDGRATQQIYYRHLCRRSGGGGRPPDRRGLWRRLDGDGQAGG